MRHPAAAHDQASYGATRRPIAASRRWRKKTVTTSLAGSGKRSKCSPCSPRRRTGSRCYLVIQALVKRGDGVLRLPAQSFELGGVLSPAQIQTVLDTLRGRSLFPIIAVALGTGLRRSELLALRWKDVDLDAGYLRVEQALEQTKRGGLVFRQPKTKYGRRMVTLAPSTVAVLREHRTAQQEQRLFLGLGRAEPSSLVFASWDGSPRSPNALTKEWSLAMKKVDLSATFHSLRHTHASTLIASGLDVLTISRRLGHGSPAITLNVYGHLFKPDDRAAAIMETALSAGREG